MECICDFAKLRIVCLRRCTGVINLVQLNHLLSWLDIHPSNRDLSLSAADSWQCEHCLQECD